MKLTKKQLQKLEQHLELEHHRTFNRFRFALWNWQQWPMVETKYLLTDAVNDLSDAWDLP